MAAQPEDRPPGQAQGLGLVTMTAAAAPERANGHAKPVTLPPLSLPERGHVSGWPQQDDPGRWRRAVTARRGLLAAVPIVLVNAVAFCGQLAFLRVHLPWVIAG